ncbi:hypothetical protein [Maridesulfovibrio frigidus]|uniref:hypothetical protein n=1 Tax=Maridesulfovibrio frigidus TaxID=340956 RepID=UPI0004E0F749|nr:hypothetical protein [Maridesulfovibrio frigidus]
MRIIGVEMISSDKLYKLMTIALTVIVLSSVGATCPVWAEDDLQANQKTVSSDVTVSPGKWSVGRLRNMSDNVELTVGVTTKGPILFLMLDEAQMKKFPKISDPLMMTRVDGSLALKTNIRKGGNHYLLFWNKYSSKPISLRFKARVKLLTTL